MLEIAAIVLPVFLVVATGYVSSLLKWVSDAEVDTLVRFATWFAVTALLFEAVATLKLGEALDPALLASYYVPVAVIFFLGIIAAQKAFGQRPGEAVASAFTASFSNSLFLGLPIITRAYGDDGRAFALAIVAVHAPILYALGITAMESTARDGGGILAGIKKVARTMGQNPMFLAIVCGFAYNVSGLPLPVAAHDALLLMARAALPLGMFGIGATLTRYRLGGELRVTGFYVVLALLVRPALVAVAAFWVFRIDPLAAKVATMMAAMPGGVNIYFFASLYNRSVMLAANALLVGTVAGIASVSLWLAFLA